ncbi:hypothetical protein AMTRI_Chr12g274800 [Amborella trichopoda]
MPGCKRCVPRNFEHREKICFLGRNLGPKIVEKDNNAFGVLQGFADGARLVMPGVRLQYVVQNLDLTRIFLRSSVRGNSVISYLFKCSTKRSNSVCIFCLFLRARARVGLVYNRALNHLSKSSPSNSGGECGFNIENICDNLKIYFQF